MKVQTGSKQMAGLLLAMFGLVLAGMLGVASPALAADSPAAGLEGYSAQALLDEFLAIDTDMAAIGGPQQAAAKMASAKLKAGKKYAFYMYYGDTKVRAWATIAKPTVTKKANGKKEVKFKVSVEMKKPTMKQLQGIGNYTGTVTGVPDSYLINYKTGKSIQKAKGVKIKEGKTKSSKYTTIAAGYDEVPLKASQTFTVTLPKKYAKKAAIKLVMRDKNNQDTKQYVMRIK